MESTLIAYCKDVFLDSFMSLAQLRVSFLFPLWGGGWMGVYSIFLMHVRTKAVVGKMTNFNLWPLPWGGGAWGAGTNMWHPETPASYESLTAPLATQIPTLWIHKPGGALILDRCRAFDLFASVAAHLWYKGTRLTTCPVKKYCVLNLCVKGTVPQVFHLHVFFMNQFPPSPWISQ